MQLPNQLPKTGWFPRLARKALQKVWDKEYAKLGKCDRWQCRNEAYALVRVGLNDLQSLVWNAFCKAEQRVLKSNQGRLGRAIREARSHDPQLTFPGMAKNRLHQLLEPMAFYYVRDPGPGGEFDELKQVRDLDFEMLLAMVAVREVKIEQVDFSKEDYEYIDRVRQSVNAPVSVTLGQLFAI